MSKIILKKTDKVKGFDNLLMTSITIGNQNLWKLCQKNGNKTPWFIDVPNEEKIVYQDEDACVIQGLTLDGRKVLCLVTPFEKENPAFSVVEDFGGHAIGIDCFNKYNARITRKNGNITEDMYFSLRTFTKFSEWVDSFYIASFEYGAMYFLKHYFVNGTIRAFVGLANYSTGKTGHIAYDINNQEFVKLPIGVDSFIDEVKFVDQLKEEPLPDVLSFPDDYQNAFKYTTLFTTLSATVAKILLPNSDDLERSRAASNICMIIEKELVKFNQEYQKNHKTI